MTDAERDLLIAVARVVENLVEARGRSEWHEMLAQLQRVLRERDNPPEAR